MKAKRRAVTVVAAGRRAEVPGRGQTPRDPDVGPRGAGRGAAPSNGRARSPPPPVAADAVDLSVDLGRGLVLPNPILVASGTFGYGVEYGDVVDVDRLGGICCKGTTLKAAHRQPDAARDRDAGRDAQLDRAPEPGRRRGHREVRRDVDDVEDAGHRQRRGRVGRTTTSRSRGGSTACPGVAGIELNISCPNVGAGGLQFAIDAGAAGEVTAAVRRATDLPLLVKLSPNVADIRPIARAIADAGADALTAINTLSGIAVAPGRGRPLLGNIYGGLSGPAVKPVALRVVYEAAQAVKIPVVAIGGVTELADVLDFLAVGAVAVQVGTAIFADPTLPVRLVDELAAECGRRGMTSYRDLIGTALPKKAGAAVGQGRRVPALSRMPRTSRRPRVDFDR